MIHPLALIGDPPEARDHEGPGFPPLIHEDARIEAFVTIDAGVEAPTRVGDCFLMKGCHVGHDSVLEDGCELAPHVIVGGYAHLGRDVKVGMGAIIRNRCHVGAGARIGMGAVVVRDVPAGEIWVGSPAMEINAFRRFSSIIRLLAEVECDHEALRMWLRAARADRLDDESEAGMGQGTANEVRPQPPHDPPPVRAVLGQSRLDWVERMLALAGLQTSQGVRDDRRPWRSGRTEDPGSPPFLRTERGTDSGGFAGLPYMRQPAVRQSAPPIPRDLRGQHGGHAPEGTGAGTPEESEGRRDPRIDPLWYEWWESRGKPR